MQSHLVFYLLSSLAQAQTLDPDELPTSLKLTERPAAAVNEMADDPEAQDKGPTLGYLEVAGNRISIYGILRLDAYWGDGRFNHNQFTYYALSHDPTVNPATRNKDNWIDWTPRMSRFGIKVDRDGLPRWQDAKLSGVFEWDFQNRATTETSRESESREIPRLRHAYVKLEAGSFSFLAGQTWDLISPIWPVANFDGMMWNSGNLGDRRPQIRFGWDPPIGGEEKLTAAIAFARTGAIDRKDTDADTERDGDASARPMIQGRVGLANLFEKHLDVGVWGHHGWEHLGTAVAGRRNYYTDSVGVDLKTKVEIFTFASEVWYGKNLSDVRGGIDQGINATRGVEIASRGGWVELQAQVAPWDVVAGGVGLDDPRNSSLSTTLATARSRNLAPHIYDRVDLGGGFAFGGEVIFWRTAYLNVEDGRANRYSLFVSWNF